MRDRSAVSPAIKARLTDAILFIALGTLSIFPLIITILMGTLLEYTAMSVFWLCLAFTVLTAFMFFNKKSLLISCAVIALAALFTYAQTFAYDWSETITYPIVQRVHNAFLFAIGHLGYEQEFVLLIIAGITLLITLLAAISLYWSFSFYPMFALGAVIFIISWSFGYPYDDINVLMFLLAMTILFIKKLNSASKDRRQRATNSKLMLYSIPVCVLIFALAVYAPKPTIEYNRESVAAFFRNPIVSVQEFLFFTFNPKYFSMHTSGFGDASGRLGGRVRLSRHEVMRVFTDERVYLVGGYMDMYTGDRWIGTFDEFVPYEENEFIFRAEYAEALKSFLTPHAWGLPGLSRIHSQEYGIHLVLSFMAERGDLYGLQYVSRLNVYTERTLQVLQDNNVTVDFDTLMPVYVAPDKTKAYLNIQSYNWHLGLAERVEATPKILFNQEVTIDIGPARTGSLFVTDKANRDLVIEGQPEIELTISGSNAIRANRALPRNTRYSFTYTRIDFSNPAVQELLELASEGFYADMLSADIPENEFTQELREIFEQWERHAREIREVFTQLPDTLPQRVFDLAEEITEGLTSDYQKARAVERFLLENFTYTLDVESLPFGEDFVDYFLFEMSEGYCVYFATAMAVLLRCVGIPTRYVVGYLMPASRTEGGYFLITGEHAHSWVDVYFEGFGWVPFEPTPPQHYMQAGLIPDFVLFSDAFLEDPWFHDHFGVFDIGASALNERRERGGQTAQQDNNPGGFFGRNRAGEPLNPIATAAIYIFGIIMIFFAYKGLLILMFYSRANSMPVNGQALEYFSKMLKVWAYDGYVKNPHETPKNFVNRLPTYNYSVERWRIEDSVEVYYKAKFSRDGITADELNTIKTTWALLYNDIIKRCEGSEKIMGYLERLVKYW